MLSLNGRLVEALGEKIDEIIALNIPDDTCRDNYIAAILTIRAAYNALANLIKYSAFGNLNQLKAAVVEACVGQEVTCEWAIGTLLDMLGGKSGEQCDLVSKAYENDFFTGQYRGLKGQYLSVVTYVHLLSSLGMGLHAAHLCIADNEPARW